jgi:hypothetical protein
MTVELLAEVPPFRVERSSSSVRRERPVPSDATSPMIPSWAANVCEIQRPSGRARRRLPNASNSVGGYSA